MAATRAAGNRLNGMSLRAVSTKEPELFVSAGGVLPKAEHQAVSAPSQTTLAMRDIVDGVSAWRLWGLLGWLDIRQRYRRSKIGPLWITISMGAMIGGMGVFYPTLFHTSVPTFLPWITLGIIIWTLISGIINDGCMAFIGAESVIKQIKLPLTIYVLRVVWRNLILFAHNVIIYVLVALWFRIWPGWSSLLLIPGLLILSLNGVSAGLVLGLVCARFRDVPQTVGSVLQIFFFLTPIFWTPESLAGQHSVLVDFNLFYYAIQLVRGPLLGHPPSAEAWLWMLTGTIGGWVVTFLIYRRLRWRIAYWV